MTVSTASGFLRSAPNPGSSSRMPWLPLQMRTQLRVHVPGGWYFLKRALGSEPVRCVCPPLSLCSALSTSTDQFCTSLVDAGGRVFSTAMQNLLQLPHRRARLAALSVGSRIGLTVLAGQLLDLKDGGAVAPEPEHRAPREHAVNGCKAGLHETKSFALTPGGKATLRVIPIR